VKFEFSICLLKAKPQSGMKWLCVGFCSECSVIHCFLFSRHLYSLRGLGAHWTHTIKTLSGRQKNTNFLNYCFFRSRGSRNSFSEVHKYSQRKYKVFMVLELKKITTHYEQLWKLSTDTDALSSKFSFLMGF